MNKFQKIAKAVEDCSAVKVKVKIKGENESFVTRNGFIIKNYERNYFDVTDTGTGRVYMNVHIRNIDPSPGLICLHFKSYVKDVLSQMSPYL